MNSAKKPGSPIPSWVYRYGLILGIALVATAFWRSTPLMSGQLSAVHAGFEADCARCHAPVGGGSQDALCRKCHADIGTTSPAVLHQGIKQNCAACHQEHRSRAYPLSLSDPEGFDHGLTGFSLVRWHKDVACVACHRARETVLRCQTLLPGLSSGLEDIEFRSRQGYRHRPAPPSFGRGLFRLPSGEPI